MTILRVRPHRAAVLSLILALGLAATAAAQSGIYLEIENSGGQIIRGDVTTQPYEETIEVFAFSHQVVIPYGSNGMPAGPAQTSPLSITTGFDRATVPLFQAQASQMLFDAFTMDVAETRFDGLTIPVYRYILQSPRLMTVTESASVGGSSVTYSFNYAQIRIEDLEHGTTATYTWNPLAASAETMLGQGLLLSSTPNPSQGPTEFRFTLPSDSDASLTLFDLRGHRVRELHRGWTKSGGDVAVWDGKDEGGTDVSQGVYIARLRTPERETTQRFTLLR